MFGSWNSNRHYLKNIKLTANDKIRYLNTIRFTIGCTIENAISLSKKEKWEKIMTKGYKPRARSNYTFTYRMVLQSSCFKIWRLCHFFTYDFYSNVLFSLKL